MGKLTECSFLHIIPEGAKIIVGLSGGADSITLLDLLHKQGYYCIAAHCNFHLRNEESNRDFIFAHSQANARKIPFFHIDFKTNEYAQARGLSTEMAARELRYNWFAELKQREKADFIAVAHHADDCIETFLINMSRGTGIKGLSGIKPKQGDIVRPLLEFTKKDILDYIKENHLEYVDDSTNFESVYLRNKFRNQIIPMLEKINPSFRQNLTNTISHLRETECFITNQLAIIKEKVVRDNGNGGWLVNKKEILNNPDSHFLLFEILSPYGFSSDITDDLIRLGDQGSGKHFYSEKYELRCERTEWEIVALQKKEERSYLIQDINNMENLPFSICFRPIPIQQLVMKRDLKHCYVDGDKISFPLTLRRFKSGDYFFPFGMKGRKKTSDYFIDNHYSQSKKENTWFLTTSKDEIIWIVGERADNRFRIDDSTQIVYEISLG